MFAAVLTDAVRDTGAVQLALNASQAAYGRAEALCDRSRADTRARHMVLHDHAKQLQSYHRALKVQCCRCM